MYILDAICLIIIVPAGILAGFALIWMVFLLFKIDLLKKFMPQRNKLKGENFKNESGE